MILIINGNSADLKDTEFSTIFAVSDDTLVLYILLYAGNIRQRIIFPAIRG
jgi:hypothetical protein